MRAARTIGSVLSAVFAASLLVAVAQTAEAFPGANGKIVFQSDRDSPYWDIYVINSNGSGLKRLTNNDPVYDSDPEWSPRSDKIVFVSGLPEDIFAMNADGTGQMDLTNSSPQREFAPAWSPSGTKIAFVRTAGGPEPSSADIYLMNSDGSDQIDLTNDPADDRSPTWSPDGSKIGFTRDGVIYVMNADGSQQVSLGVNGSQPSWSPDGAKIAFSATCCNSPVPDLYVMNADGSGVMSVTDTPTGELYPSWSPDGTQLIFALSPNDSEVLTTIYVINPDGSGLKKVTGDSGTNSRPDWQALQLTLTTSKSKVNYKRSVTVTAHLLWFDSTPNKFVSIYKIPYGGSKTLVLTGEVDSSGNLSVGVVLLKKTTFLAEWSGDPDHPAGGISNPSIVSVYPLVSGRLSGYYGVSGAYKLYHFTQNCPKFHRGCPTFTGAVAPNHAGARVYIRLQLFISGAWRNVLYFSVRLNSKSNTTVIFVYGDQRVKGIKSRTRVEFKGDADHLAKASAWSYFKVTS
jgi:Tol biopolymer transport system component